MIRVTTYDADTQEAEFEIMASLFDNGDMNHDEYAVKAYCHPFNYPTDTNTLVLYGLCTENIWLEESMHAPRKTERGYFSYRLTAKVVDKSIQHVKLGEYDFFLDTPLPKDIENNSFISFDVMRIDARFNNNDKG